MKKVWSVLYIILLFLGTALGVSAQQIPAKPDPPRLVNDLAHVMTADQIASLESKLDEYDDSSSIQIAVVTMSTIGDDEIGDVALGILRNWGVGNKKTNNGVVVLAAIKEHKVFIATGYGMEGVLPDITVKSIIDNEMVPNFKGGGNDNFYRGFDQAADAIIKASRGEYKAPDGYAQRGRRHSNGTGNIIGVFVIVFVILIVIFGRGGGGSGGGGLFGGGGFLPFILGSMLGSSSRGWGNSGGGGWSGGGSGGGGGFGGFGGGSGGGGGAGGSW